MPNSAARVLPLRAATPAPSPPRPVGKPWPAGELAAFLSVSTQTIGKLAKVGRLRRLDPEAFGRRVLIADDSVQALLAGKAANAGKMNDT